MKQLKIFVAVIFTGICFSSCIERFVFNRMGFLEDEVSVKRAGNSAKQIVYLPMHHIGKKVFYADVKRKMDSLRKEGFVFYYEGVRINKEKDPHNIDTICMKFRKVMGIDLRGMNLKGGYIDSSNNTILGRKSNTVAKYHLINQPRYYQWLDTLVDRRVDVDLQNILSHFENEYGSIPLDDCDFKTKSTEKYSCKKYKSKEGKKMMVIDDRNKFIANEIIKDSHTKIALVYGAAHFKGILKELQQKDSTWKIY